MLSNERFWTSTSAFAGQEDGKGHRQAKILVRHNNFLSHEATEQPFPPHTVDLVEPKAIAGRSCTHRLILRSHQTLVLSPHSLSLELSTLDPASPRTKLPTLKSQLYIALPNLKLPYNSAEKHFLAIFILRSSWEQPAPHLHHVEHRLPRPRHRRGEEGDRSGHSCRI
jgi:hypothetical protein